LNYAKSSATHLSIKCDHALLGLDLWRVSEAVRTAPFKSKARYIKTCHKSSSEKESETEPEVFRLRNLVRTSLPRRPPVATVCTTCLKKGKDIPVTGHGGPWGCERSRLPHYLHKRLTDGGKVVSPTRRPHFSPRFLPALTHQNSALCPYSACMRLS
jgi:hypothetical protein